MRHFMLSTRFCFTLLLLASALSPATPIPQEVLPSQELPPELAIIPPDTLFFMHLKVEQLYGDPVVQKLKKYLPPEVYRALNREAGREIGMQFEDISSFTQFWRLTSPLGKENQMVMLVTARKSFAQDQLIKALVPGAVKKTAGGKEYYAPKESEHGLHLHFLDSRRALLFMNLAFGETDPKAAERLLHSLGKKKEKGPLSPVIAEAREKLLVMGLHIPEDFRKTLDDFGGMPDQFSWIEPVMQMKMGGLTLDLGDNSVVRLRFQFTESAKARDALAGVQHGLKFLLEQLEPLAVVEADKVARSKNTAELSHTALALLRSAETTLKSAQVQVAGNDLLVNLTLKTNDLAMAHLAKLIVALRDRELGKSNLREIGLAMHNYHADHTHLPLHAIYGKNGKPLLSWRVALLPYLGQEELYKQFKQDESWDSDHNKKLLARMPNIYRHPRLTPDEPHFTYYKVFVSRAGDKPAATFMADAKRTLVQLAGADGTSNTIMVIEGGAAVPWTKPEDIAYDVKKPLPYLDAAFPEGWLALFCDGSVRKIKKGAAEKLLKQIITYNGGENEDTTSIFADD